VNSEPEQERTLCGSGKDLKRSDIVRRLTAICKQLEAWALVHKPVNPVRITAYRTAIYGYSVAITALKDEELELRVMELEKKMKDGVLIVNEQSKQKTA
jgi:hypothetical protein